MAVTGFAHSVVRAGIMMIIVSFASSNLRIADSLNNLGFAAIVLTAFNPYAVADIGMLLSFSATTGIILWSRPIERSVLRFFTTKTSVRTVLSERLSIISKGCLKSA